jgi:hypothetical protein
MKLRILQSPSVPSNRRFGLFFASIFAGISIYFFFESSKLLPIFTLLIGVCFFFASMLFPKVLEPLNRLWFKIGIVLGKLTNPLILGAIFFVFITPISIIARLFGRDELRLKKKSLKSYWVERIPVGPATNSFSNQF